MKFNWLQKAAKLECKGTPFAIATVVNASAPTSAKPVAKAIITADGKMQGWVGGGCSREVVIENALTSIQTGVGSLIRLSPNPDPTVNHSVKEVLLSCESGGTLEIHIEPVIPTMKFLIYGATPAAVALAKLASVMDVDVHLLGAEDSDSDLPESVTKSDEFSSPEVKSVAVVATQGEGDLKALKAALKSKPIYLSLIASRKKAKNLLKELSAEGFGKDDLDQIKYPAGLDIGAVTPEEIAVSILAEIVQVLKNRTEPISADQIAGNTEEIKDPVCGMTVNPDSADYSLTHEKSTYYFCCKGCLTSFEKEPSSFIEA